MLRRSYAFEAEGVPEEVVDSLETVEDVVDQNCATPADCDAMLEKVEQQEEKFDGALQDMADAAKDAQASGNSGALAESIEPAMNELREVAEDTGIAIGTAAEGFGMTQNDLLRIRSYLVGTREIIESKKAELMGMESSYAMESDSGDDDDDEDDSDSKSKSDEDDDSDSKGSDSEDDDEDSDDEEEKKAEEAFLYDYCLECYMDTLDAAMESEVFEGAMEGANVDAAGAAINTLKVVRGLKKEMKAAEKEGDYRTAAAKAKEAASKFDELSAKVSALPQSTSSAVLANIAVALAALGAIAIGKKIAGAASYDSRLTRSRDKANKMLGKYGENSSKYKKAADKVSGIVDKHNAGFAKRSARSKKIRDLKAKIPGHDAAANVGQKIVNGRETAIGAVRGARDKVTSTVGGAVGGLKPVQSGKQFMRTHPKARGAASAVVGGAKTAGGIAGKAAGASAAGTAGLMFLKKKQVVDEEGNVHSSRLEPNDVNALIAAIRKACSDNKQKYLNFAKQYEEMAANASSSAAAESFIDMMDGLKISSTPANEGFDVDAFYEGFSARLVLRLEPATEAIDAAAFLSAFINGDDE